MSGLERYVLQKLPTAGWAIAQTRRVIPSYADDLNVMCKTESELTSAFETINMFLARLGLACEASKCECMCVGDTSASVSLGTTTL